ncbi:MAG: NAD(P)/FAD-dependent oxidoreductase [Planctomycetota bacterium]|jgi:uncharacterized FAD-dependent dehydrogenase
MPIFVAGITLKLDEPENVILERAAKRLRIPLGDIAQWALVRRSLDARRHDRLCFTYNIELKLAGPAKNEQQLVRRLRRNDVKMLLPQKPLPLEPGHESLPQPPIIVGFGPAGMFAGLILAKMGYKPLIIDRGQNIANRHRDVLVEFYRNRKFNPESNLLFGEGGAGTYSDGKLYTRLNDPRVPTILQELYRHGAHPDILIDGKPHIGSDKLPNICRNIRQKIIDLGGQVRFASRLQDVLIRDGVLEALVVNHQKIPCGPVIMGLGLSARDTFRMLAQRGVKFQAKPFQVGVRLEHPQEMVDRWQYGQHAGHHRLPPAEYNLVAKDAAGKGQDVFTFCICPGGQILPTNEVAGSIVTNGASRSKRDGQMANCGLVLTLNPNEMFPHPDPFKAVEFLQQIEQSAYQLTGQNYQLPAQRANDFLQNQPSSGDLKTSYPLDGQWAEIRKIIPPYITDALAKALQQLDKKLPGFAGPDTLVTAPETRASSPIRISRNPQTRQSVNTRNLYPVGEGAGYAGGIISSAIDGIKSAELIIKQYKPIK